MFQKYRWTLFSIGAAINHRQQQETYQQRLKKRSFRFWFSSHIHTIPCPIPYLTCIWTDWDFQGGFEKLIERYFRRYRNYSLLMTRDQEMATGKYIIKKSIQLLLFQTCSICPILETISHLDLVRFKFSIKLWKYLWRLFSVINYVTHWQQWNNEQWRSKIDHSKEHIYAYSS